MCALQGCSSNSTSQAGSGNSPTAPGNTGASSGGPAGSSGSSGSSASSAASSGGPTASSGSSASSSGGPVASSGNFTAPAVTSAVQGWGSYQIINAHRIHVQVCAKKVANVFAIGVEVFAYNSDYSKHGALASVILPETPGQMGCTQTYLFYTAHLKVFSFIGQGGVITQKSPMKSIF
jgi:hypothetical protein